MSFEKMRVPKSKTNYKYACWRGYCPTLEERENSRIKEMANRLNATSDKEVLTNILEWENRNIVFWFERYPLSLAILSTILAALIISPFLMLSAQMWFWCFTALVSVIVTLSLIAAYMIHSYRKLPLKRLFNIFPPSVSINSILENKLCVCRDYAKLTACLLFNLYPEKEIYFAHAPSHVATGIMVGKKLYILDKYLPVATIEKWHELWHKGRFSDKTIERIKGTFLEPIDLNCLLSKTSSSILDTHKLANEMKTLLSVQRSTDGTKSTSLKILRWKNGAVLYEDDEIVNYSLGQRLRMAISAEMLDINDLANIEIDRKKDDLIFRVELVK